MRGRIVAAPQQDEIQPLSHVPPGVGPALAAFARDGRLCGHTGPAAFVALRGSDSARDRPAEVSPVSTS
jgi:hypothetical protein